MRIENPTENVIVLNTGEETIFVFTNPVQDPFLGYGSSCGTGGAFVCKNKVVVRHRMNEG